MNELKSPNKKIYSGKAKNIYIYDEDQILMEFTNNITAYNNKRKDNLDEKGKINCEISEIIFNKLKQYKIPNHYVKKINDTDVICKKVNIIPLEVILRNYAKGSIVKKFGIKEYLRFEEPIVEFSLKNDELNDPLISESQIIALKIATKKELTKIIKYTKKINDILFNFFDRKNITLLDFKIEFGKDKNNKIILADEISPDSMRLENLRTKTKYDKDIYRNELGDVLEGYRNFLKVLKNDFN